MNYFIPLLLGSLFGSFPTAYLLLKKLEEKNVFENGSGNMGAMNTYKVSKSKRLALLVFFIDFLKGLIPVLILKHFNYDINAISIAIISSVFFHCYNFYLKFRGGKGLATALGASVAVFPAIPLVWLIFWIISFIYKRHINFANITASILTIMISIYNKDIMNGFNFDKFEISWNFSLFTGILFAVILSKHYKEIKSLIRN